MARKYDADGSGKGKVDTTGLRVKKRGVSGFAKKAGVKLQNIILFEGHEAALKFARGVRKLLSRRVDQFNTFSEDCKPVSVDGLDFSIEDEDFVIWGNVARPLKDYGVTPPSAVSVAREIARVNTKKPGEQIGGYVSGSLVTPSKGTQVPFVMCVCETIKITSAGRACHPDAMRKAKRKLDLAFYMKELESVAFSLLDAYCMNKETFPDDKSLKQARDRARKRALEETKTMTRALGNNEQHTAGTLASFSSLVSMSSVNSMNSSSKKRKGTMDQFLGTKSTTAPPPTAGVRAVSSASKKSKSFKQAKLHF